MLRQNSTCLLRLPLTCDKTVPQDSLNSQASFTSESCEIKRYHINHYDLPSARPTAPVLTTVALIE